MDVHFSSIRFNANSNEMDVDIRLGGLFMHASMNSKGRLLQLGCGSVGGVIAGGLLHSGNELTIVTNNDQITHAINTNGLHVFTPKEEWTVPVHVYTHLDEVPGTFDSVLLAMKATDVEDAASEVASHLSPTGTVVTLQNGVVEERIAEILGHEHVIGALVGWGATMHSPGIYEMTSFGEIVLGELDGRFTARAQNLCSTLDTAVSTRLSGNIYGALWSKLAINCTITTLGAVTGQLLGEMLNRWSVRRLALTITSEVIDVAKAFEISMEPVGGTLEIERLYLPVGRRGKDIGWDILTRQVIMFIVGLRFRRLKSSMLQSLERGRQAEIDFMNGYVVKKGALHGISTPTNLAVTKMVQEIELGERSIHPDNLKELLHTKV
jgi:2-dehydropantoate 2-reductase